MQLKCTMITSCQTKSMATTKVMRLSSLYATVSNDAVLGLGRRLLHEGPDTVDELLDRHLAKKEEKPASDEDDELSTRRRLTSTRREALSLYRDILRATRFFVWPNPQGVPWRDVLRENARKEFEDARLETDPEVVTRLLIGGRDAVQSAIDKLVARMEKDRGSGDGGRR